MSTLRERIRREILAEIEQAPRNKGRVVVTLNLTVDGARDIAAALERQEDDEPDAADRLLAWINDENDPPQGERIVLDPIGETSVPKDEIRRAVRAVTGRRRDVPETDPIPDDISDGAENG